MFDQPQTAADTNVLVSCPRGSPEHAASGEFRKFLSLQKMRVILSEASLRAQSKDPSVSSECARSRLIVPSSFLLLRKSPSPFRERAGVRVCRRSNAPSPALRAASPPRGEAVFRSEEHTSELQSHV